MRPMISVNAWMEGDPQAGLVVGQPSVAQAQYIMIVMEKVNGGELAGYIKVPAVTDTSLTLIPHPPRLCGRLHAGREAACWASRQPTCKKWAAMQLPPSAPESD